MRFLFLTLLILARTLCCAASPQETLSAIEGAIKAHKPGGYFHFEPEDLELASDESRDLFDRIEMQEAIAFEGDAIFKSFPDSGSPQIAPDIAFLKYLKSLPIDLYIGDYLTPPDLRETLFGPGCAFVPAAIRNRFNETYSVTAQAEEILSRKKGYKVAAIALPGTGKFIQKRLLERFDDLFILDFTPIMDSLPDPLLLQEQLTSPIHIVYTSALIPQFFEERKQEYIHCLKILNSYGFLPETYVVEAGPSIPESFFESYATHIHYADTNDPRLKNKGVNEARAVRSFLESHSFPDDHMIVKITGRYFFNNDSLLKLAASRPACDAIASQLDPNVKVCTGCFAMRFRDYKKMMQEMDLEKMEREMIDIEKETMIYLKKMEARGQKVLYLDKMGITANIGNGIVTQW